MPRRLMALLPLLLQGSLALQGSFVDHFAGKPQFLKEPKMEVLANGAVTSGRSKFGSTLPPEVLDVLVGNSQQERKDVQKFWNGLGMASSPSLTDTFDVEQLIGSGSYGWVFQARNRHSGEQVALKMIPMAEIRDIIAEWHASKRLRQRGVSGVVLTEEQAYAVTRGETPKVMWDQIKNDERGEDYVCLVQEFMPGGTLEEKLVQDFMAPEQKQLSSEMLFKCLTDVATTLAEMHKNGIQHRDIRPENIMLVKQNGVIVSAKLCDLGCSQTGTDQVAFRDDINQFGMTIGMTLFRVALGEDVIDKMNLKEKEENPELVQNLTAAVAEKKPELHMFLHLFKKILGGTLDMSSIAWMMAHASIQHS